MNTPNFRIKAIRALIVFFLGLICLFAALITLNYYAAKPLSQKFSAKAAAQRMLAEAGASANTREKAPISYRTGFSSASVRSEGSIMLVKNGEFGGASQEEQSMMEVLTEMSGSGKKKIAPVHLAYSDLDKKIIVSRPGGAGAPLNSSAVPKPGEAAFVTGAKTMVTAPVDYKVFRDAETWSAFASSHKGRFPDVDFSKEQMLILVSVSEMPSGIFKISGVEKKAKETVVLYRVDPLVMSAENGAKERDFYSAVPITKDSDVRLEQIP
jgi:hypothetical protein